MDWTLQTKLSLEKVTGQYHQLIPRGAGEAAALFVQNWWSSSVGTWFMKLTILDIYHALPARHQPWFKETRQAWVDATFEEVHKGALPLKAQR